VFWLATGAEELSMGQVVTQVEALAQLARDIDARLAAGGTGGLAGTGAIYEQLRAVLDGVTAGDLERMTRRVADLQRELAEVTRRIAAMRDLKALFERIE
jgi:hypothetical protein